MRIRIWTTLCILTLTASSCSQPAETGMGNAPLRVTIGSEPGIGMEVRTALEDDGFTVRWVKGDRIALWSINETDQAQFSAVPFFLYSFNETYRSAKFTGTIEPMPEGNYTYCALSPVPESTEGTKGIYTIPAMQDGAFHSEWDVMTAATVTGEALQEGDNSGAINLAFTHKMHLLEIRIPENRLGEPVKGLEITFPVPVAGTFKVDAANPDAEPELINGNNTLTIELPTPVEANEVVYATIAPVEIDKSLPVSLLAFGETGQSRAIRIPGKNFAEGHYTPIAFTVPEMEMIYTKLVFSLNGTGEATLGEKVERFTVTGPEGCDVGNGTNSCSFEVNEAGKYEIVFRHEFADGLSGETFTVSYESENAVVSDTFTMPPLKAETSNPIPALDIPYLFEEKFDELTSDGGSFSFHDNAKTGGVNLDGSTEAISLETYGLPGWTAARVGGENGKCIRICCRTEHGAAYATRYHGRADSPALSGIKAGKTVAIEVTFDYGGGYNGYDFGAKVAYGYTTAQGTIDSDTGTDWHIDGATSFTPYSYNGSFQSTPDRRSYRLTDVTSSHRLSWEIQTTGNKWTKNGNHWLYLDNIQVTIK